MDITELITQDRVICNCRATSKKRVIEALSETLANSELELQVAPRLIFDSLISRERLGSTSLGHGVALPHGRFSKIRRAVGAFLKLSDGVNFDAVDEQPVDLIFGLLVPDQFTDQYLNIISYLAEMFNDHSLCQQLRNCNCTQLLFDLIRNWQPLTICETSDIFEL